MGLLDKVKTALLLKRALDRLKEANMKGGLKVALFGLASAVAVSVVAQVNAVCPDLLTRWPEMLVAGVLAGVGLWMKSPKQA